MIQLSELTALGFDATKYNALKAKLTAKGINPTARITLLPYAPTFTDITPPTLDTASDFDLFVSETEIMALVVTAAGFSVMTYSPITNTWPILAGGGSAYTTGVSIGYDSAQAGAYTMAYVDSGTTLRAYSSRLAASITYTHLNHTIKRTAVVDGQGVHLLGLTSHGNWRLGYGADETNYPIYWSDIYWPYQVRSFDAVRLGSYDVIALVADLPSLIDVSTSGTKTQTTEQRVQGIVLFKFDRATKKWSDYFVVDSCDNVDGVAFSNLRMSTSGGYAFMTYARQHETEVGVCVSRSVDGLNWENPIFYQPTPYPSLAHVPVFQFLRFEEYMYFCSANNFSRSPSTGFAGYVNQSTIEDITAYVTSLSAQIGTQRAVSVKLTKPDGYSGLLDSRKRMRALVEFGYWNGADQLLVPLLEGDVEVKASDAELANNSTTLTIKDTSALPQIVGISGAREWEGVSFRGENFAPTIEEDETGSSGLHHVAIKTGAWTGGDKTAKTRGLTYLADGTEGFALSTAISRALCGTFSGEMSFYHPVGEVRMGTGAVSEGLQGGERAGMAFHALDEHNCWFLRWVPATNGAGAFALVKRIGTVVGDTVSHHTVVVTPSYYETPNYDANYQYTYSGRITVEWKYNLVRIYRHYPNAAAQKILEYEAKGMGDLDFNAKNPDGTPNYPYLEGNYRGRPYTGGAAGYLAFSPKDGYTNILGDGGFEGTFTGIGYNNWAGTNIYVKQMTATIHAQSTLRYRSGSASWRCLNQASLDNDVLRNRKCGCRIETLHNLNLASGTVCRVKGYVFVDTLDEHGDMAVYANFRQYGSRDSDRNGAIVEITETGKWVPFALSYTHGDTVDFIETLVYVHGSSRSTDTIFYVDDVTVEKYTGAKSYVYFGNVDMSDGLHAFTANDAMNALYAFAGHHHTTRKYAINEAPNNAYTIGTVDLPYIANFTLAATSGKIGLCSKGTSPSPVEIDWTASETKITVKCKTGLDGVRRLPVGLGLGQMRVVVTTQRNEGTLFKNDQAGVQDWITVAIYLNERLHLCHSFPLYDKSLLGTKIFASTGAISGVTVDQLPRLVPFYSVDPGENVASGIGRIVGQSRAEHLYRFDDTVLIARPVIDHHPANLDWALPITRTLRLEDSENYQVPVHYRLVGAWSEMDIFDAEGMEDSWRHTFTRKDDPNLMTDAEMQTEKAYVLYELNAARRQRAVELAFNPLMEHGDYVSLAGEYWTIDTLQFSLAANAEGTLQMTGSLVLHGADA
ncbi:hypothetical protein ANAEL_02568 [Anaerolineales bacterium]|nr:hypothetical protein ANAEL_02568 [Anaerolineales bacterium]